MVRINSITISPPLLNSACAWASSFEQLKELYDSPYTGAVTTRSSTVEGFVESSSKAVAFTDDQRTSINCYGYSPHPLPSYLTWINTIISSSSTEKPFIISVVAPADIAFIRTFTPALPLNRIAVELNLSCPNIKGSPPKGYDFSVLPPVLDAIAEEVKKSEGKLTVGLKLPPYLYEAQFVSLLDAIEGKGISFLTCTNTLGNSLLFENKENSFALPSPLGGLAGEAIHPLALGNVYTFTQLLKKRALEENIQVIGVGGVTSKEAVDRMKKAGASVVGCATFLGKEGVKAFEILSL